MGKLERATVEQAYTKSGWYGDTGSGKTKTSLMIAKELCKHTKYVNGNPEEEHNGKIAMIATERAMDFYAEEFEFYPARVSNVEEALEALEGIIEEKYSVVIVDQVSTLWESAQDSYIKEEHDKMSRAWEVIEKSGNVPFQGWKKIKKPYKKFIKMLMDAPIHVFLLGRIKTEYEMNGEKIKKVGECMDSEKSTPYEPHIFVKMEFQKRKGGLHLALVEKDHSGTIQGQVFENPDGHMFDLILKKLGKIQGETPKLVEDDNKMGIEDIPVRESQIKILKSLAKKKDIDIGDKVSALSSDLAAELINKMTLGDYSYWE